MQCRIWCCSIGRAPTDEPPTKKINLNERILMVSHARGPLSSVWPMCNSRVLIREASRSWQNAAVIDTESHVAVRALIKCLHTFDAVHWDPEAADRAVASWSASVHWRFRSACVHRPSASGLAKTWRGLRRFMESPLVIFAAHCDHEPRTSRSVPPTKCCRRLAGSAFLRFLCRQDAGSTLGFMESRRHPSAAPTPCRSSTASQVMRAEWIFRMAQCIPAMGADMGALYSPQMPVRSHAAALFLCRSSGLEQAMTSGSEPKASVYLREQRDCASALQSSFDSPAHLRIV